MGKKKALAQSTDEDNDLTLVRVKLRKETMNRLNRIARLTDNENRTQVLVTALALTEMVADTIRAGGKVVLQHKNGSKETINLVGL